MTFDLELKIGTHRLLVPWETFATMLVFQRLFVFELGAGTGQTDRRTDGRTDEQHT